MLMYFDIRGMNYHAELWEPLHASLDEKHESERHPLVMLHGFTGSSSSWKGFAENWKAHSVGAAIDIVGHGRTDSPDNLMRYDIESAAEDLNLLLDQAGIEKTDLLGYSMGGRLAITFAVKYPERVRKLILESTSPGLETEKERKARRISDEKLAQQILLNGVEEFVEYWENIPLFESQKGLPKDVRMQIRAERLAHSPKGLANSLRGMGTGAQVSWWDELSGLDMPVLLITGSLDEKFCRIGKKMLDKLKDGYHITVDHAGHAIHVEKPEKFGTIVSGFLTSK
jgi:2-succinyl-6-hydroxy-2,4-cyclohexadiene-1-carboxylate synthase